MDDAIGSSDVELELLLLLVRLSKVNKLDDGKDRVTEADEPTPVSDDSVVAVDDVGDTTSPSMAEMDKVVRVLLDDVTAEVVLLIGATGTVRF